MLPVVYVSLPRIIRFPKRGITIVIRIIKAQLILHQMTNANNRISLSLKPNIPGKKSLAFLFEEINAFNRKLKPENTVSRKKRNAESLLFSLY
jgi:hypothetical protein